MVSERESSVTLRDTVSDMRATVSERGEGKRLMPWNVNRLGTPTLAWYLIGVLCLGAGAWIYANLDPVRERSSTGFILAAATFFVLMVFAITRIARFPPRPRVRVEQDGTRVLRVAKWRRLMFIATCATPVVIVGSHAERHSGWVWIAGGFAVCGWLLYVMFGEQYRLTNESIERSGGLRPSRRWKWQSVRLVIAVRGGLFVTDSNGRELALSSRWFDGFADLASDVLRRVPPGAFPDEEIRELVRRQAEGK